MRPYGALVRHIIAYVIYHRDIPCSDVVQGFVGRYLDYCKGKSRVRRYFPELGPQTGVRLGVGSALVSVVINIFGVSMKIDSGVSVP